MKTIKKVYDPADRMLAAIIKVPVEEYVRGMELIDEGQRDAIMTRLLSDSDREIREGIQMFKDLDI